MCPENVGTFWRNNFPGQKKLGCGNGKTDAAAFSPSTGANANNGGSDGPLQIGIRPTQHLGKGKMETADVDDRKNEAFLPF